MTAAYHEAHVRAADVEMLDCEYLDQQAYFDQPILVSVRCMASPFTPVVLLCKLMHVGMSFDVTRRKTC